VTPGYYKDVTKTNEAI